jgi:hypothetical protein
MVSLGPSRTFRSDERIEEFSAVVPDCPWCRTPMQIGEISPHPRFPRVELVCFTCPCGARGSSRVHRDEMSIGAFLKEQVFDTDMTRAMGQAFDAACKQVNGGRRPTERVKKALAKQIVELARTGERDPQCLCAKALETSGLKDRHG